jgi:hypothetical protein
LAKIGSPDILAFLSNPGKDKNEMNKENKKL